MAREAVLEYCEEDVRMSLRLLLRAELRGHAAMPGLPMSSACCTGRTTAPRRSHGSKRRGMPIDMPLWNLVQENKAAVIARAAAAV